MSNQDARANPAIYRSLPKRVVRRLQAYSHRLFRRKNLVFRHDGPFPPEQRTDCTIQAYEDYGSLPELAKQGTLDDSGLRLLEKDGAELEAHGVIWVALIDDRVASAVFTRAGRYFQRWFLELADDDIVLFRGRTHPDFRGRGLMPSLIRHATNRLLEHGGNAYTDARIYNRPSIRCIKKAGFVHVKTMKPISRDEALGR